MNLQRGEFYPHPWSFDACSLVMCKQLCSKSYFPIGRSSFLTGGDNLKLGGLRISGLKAEVKAFLEDTSVRIFSWFAQWCYFLAQLLSFGFCPAHGTTNPVLVHHRHWRFSVISAFPVLGLKHRGKERLMSQRMTFVGRRSLTNRCRGNEAGILVSLGHHHGPLSYFCSWIKADSGLSRPVIVLVVAGMLSWEGCRASALYQYCRYLKISSLCNCLIPHPSRALNSSL